MMSLVKAVQLLRVAMRATSRSGVSLQDIREEIDCSHRTAQRWTDALEEVFPQTMIGDDEDRQRRWRIPARSVAPLLTPSGDEMAALGTAIAELEERGLSEPVRLLRDLREKVRTLSPLVGRARNDVDEEILLQALGHATRPGPKPSANEGVEAALLDSFKGPFLIEALYRKENGEKRRRRLAPYGLLLGIRRYLVARDADKSRSSPMQHFRLEGIFEVRVLAETFEVDSQFDLRSHAETGFGSYVDEDAMVDVVWRFAPEAAARAREFLFHPRQKLESEKDGSLLVRFRACGVLEMCWFLYQWGESVEVLQPEELRRMVHPHRQPFIALP